VRESLTVYAIWRAHIRGNPGEAQLGLCCLILLFSAAIYSCEGNHGDGPMRLPDKVGRWTLREAPQRIEPAAYSTTWTALGTDLAYRLKQIDVYRYSADDNTEILAEIYKLSRQMTLTACSLSTGEASRWT